MPVLHIGDIEIVAHAQQLTSPGLHIKNADGEIYHVAVMPVGGGSGKYGDIKYFVPAHL